MYIDTQSTFSDKQDLAASAGDVPSTNILDTGVNDSDIGLGERTYIEFRRDEAFTSGGSATVRIRVQSSNAENFGTGVVDHFDTGAVAYASAVAPAPLALPLGVKRYLRVLYTIGTAATTGGKMSAFLVKDVQRNKAFPIGHS